MPDSYDQWHQESYEEDGGTGLLWRTARNAAVLLACCLLVWAVLKWGGEQVAERGGEPTLVQSQDAASAPIQISRTMATGAEIVIPAGPNGHFLIAAEIEDVEILFLVDTGASQVILTVEDAERLGHSVDSLEFSDRFQTANGTILRLPDYLGDHGVDLNDILALFENYRAISRHRGGPLLSHLRSLKGYDEPETLS